MKRKTASASLPESRCPQEGGAAGTAPASCCPSSLSCRNAATPQSCQALPWSKSSRVISLNLLLVNRPESWLTTHLFLFMKKILATLQFLPCTTPKLWTYCSRRQQVFLRIIISTFQKNCMEHVTSASQSSRGNQPTKSRPEKTQHKILLALSEEFISITVSLSQDLAISLQADTNSWALPEAADALQCTLCRCQPSRRDGDFLFQRE